MTLDATAVEMTERAILYTALQREDVRRETLATAAADWFVDAQHRRLFAAMRRLDEDGHDFDSLAIHRAARRQASARVGDVVLDSEWLAQAASDTVLAITLENLIETHLPVLLETYRARTLAVIGQQLVDRALSQDSTAVLSWISGRLDELARATKRDRTEHTDVSLVASAINPVHARELVERAGPYTLIPCLDKLGVRLTIGQLVTIAGRPGECKTLVVTMVALGASTQCGVLVFALEDGIQGWAERRVQMVTGGTKIHQLAGENASPLAYERHSEYIAKADGRPLYVVDNAVALSVFDIISMMRQHKEKHPELGVVIIDQTYNIAGYYVDGKSGSMLTYNVTRIIDQLLVAAREVGVALVLLQHVNRTVQGRPSEGHISDSDGFAKKARKVIICSRDRDENQQPIGDLNINLVKHTNGPRGYGDLPFDGETQRLGDWSDPYFETECEA